MSDDTRAEFDSLHPHERTEFPIPSAFDNEGRCLVCALQVEAEGLRRRLDEYVALVGWCGFEGRDGDIALVHGERALHLAVNWEPFAIYRRMAVPVPEPSGEHLYRGRKSDGFGMCSCGELVWECDYAEHVSEATQEAASMRADDQEYRL